MGNVCTNVFFAMILFIPCWINEMARNFWILLTILSSWQTVSSLTDHHRLNAYTFASARCKSRCLRMYFQKDSILGLRLTRLSSKCKSDNVKCKECVKTCYSPEIIADRKNCDVVCDPTYTKSSYRVCFDSCTFITNVINGQKSGNCPTNLHYPSFLVLSQCLNDWDCSAGEKCCQTKEGQHLCTEALFDQKQEKVPINIEVKRLKIDSCTVSWKLSPELYSTTNTFIVEKRFSRRSKNEDSFSHWESAGQISKLHIRMRNLLAGSYYQFRVAAVNKNGYSGYSKPSAIIKLPFNYTQPSAPLDLQVIQRNYEGDQRQTILSWNPPKIMDGRLRRYRVIYFKNTAYNVLTLASRQRVLNIEPSQHSVVLKYLDPGSSYEVMVFAVVYVKNRRIRGKRATLQFTTLPAPTNSMQSQNSGHLERKGQLMNKISTTEHPIKVAVSVLNITVNDSSAMVHLSWKLLDPGINGLEFKWTNTECNAVMPVSHIPARLMKYTFSNMKSYCYYALQIQAYKKNKKNGDALSLDIFTGPKIQGRSVGAKERNFYKSAATILKTTQYWSISAQCWSTLLFYVLFHS